MSAYNRDSLSVEAYLVRIIAALCRQMGGELRVKGELIDTVGEATALLKSWDSAKQELVLTVAMGTFSEVYRVVPERQHKEPIPIVPHADAPREPPLPINRIDDEPAARVEQVLKNRAFVKRLLAELRARDAARRPGAL